MTNHYSVLAIEDNMANGALLRGIFRLRPNWELTIAQCGKEALAAVEVGHPDVVLLDLDLPDMHGSFLLKALRDMPGCDDLRAIIVTADSTDEQRQVLLDIGVNGYLTKPFNVPDLISTIESVLGCHVKAA